MNVEVGRARMVEHALTLLMASTVPAWQAGQGSPVNKVSLTKLLIMGRKERLISASVRDTQKMSLKLVWIIL